MSAPVVSLSPLETERFGVVSARCSIATPEDFEHSLRFCRDHQVALLVARCAATDHSVVHAIEQAGGQLGDTLVYYARDLSTDLDAAQASETVVRPFQVADAPAVKIVAAGAFKGYLGHYHTDPRLDRERADATYADWAHRACSSKSAGHEVLVAERAGRLVGFLSLRLNAPEEAEIVLNGVAPEAQRSGVYRVLLASSLLWGREQGATRVVVSTQLTNLRAQRAWIRAGFEPSGAQYTFHLWFRR